MQGCTPVKPVCAREEVESIGPEPAAQQGLHCACRPSARGSLHCSHACSQVPTWHCVTLLGGQGTVGVPWGVLGLARGLLQAHGAGRKLPGGVLLHGRPHMHALRRRCGPSPCCSTSSRLMAAAVRLTATLRHLQGSVVPPCSCLVCLV